MLTRLPLAVLLTLSVPAWADAPAPAVRAVVRVFLEAGEDAVAVQRIVEKRLLLLDEKGSAPVSTVSWQEEDGIQVATVQLAPSPCKGRLLACIADAFTRGGAAPESPCTPDRLAAWEGAIRDVAARPGVVVLSRADASSQRALRDVLEAEPALATAAFALDDRAGVEIEHVDGATAGAAIARVHLDGRRVVWMEAGAPGSSRTVAYAVPVAPGLLIDGVESAAVRADDGWEPQVVMKLEKQDGEAFATLSTATVQQILTIEVDGTLVSAPVVVEPITGGHVSILLCHADDGSANCLERTGRFAAVMQGGALPDAVTVVHTDGRCTDP